METADCVTKQVVETTDCVTQQAMETADCVTQQAMETADCVTQQVMETADCVTCCRVAMHVYYICPWRVRGNTWGEARGTVAVLFPDCITVVFVDRRVYVSMYHPVQKDKEL